MSPAGRAGPVTAERIFASGSYGKFQLDFRDKAEYPGNEFWREMRESKQTWRNTKIQQLPRPS